MAVDLKGDAAQAAQQFLDQAVQEAKQARTRYATYAQCYTVAEAAVNRTIRKVENSYNDQLLDVIKTNQRGETAVAYDQLVALAQLAARTVHQEMDQIEEAVARANIEFLSSLNLDQPSKTESPHRGGG